MSNTCIEFFEQSVQQTEDEIECIQKNSSTLQLPPLVLQLKTVGTCFYTCSFIGWSKPWNKPMNTSKFEHDLLKAACIHHQSWMIETLSHFWSKKLCSGVTRFFFPVGWSGSGKMIQYTLHNLKSHTSIWCLYIYIVSYRLYGYGLDTVFMYLIYESMHMCIDVCIHNILCKYLDG